MLKRKQYDNKIILRRREKHEILKGEKGAIICKNCDAAYCVKSWRHSLSDCKNLDDTAVKFSLCPACQMIKNKQFEGEIVVKNAPEKIKNDLKHLIKSFCQKAYERDPMDRLIAVKETNGNLTITTTENQLAVKLAKKIGETFKKPDVKIVYSPAPSDVAYIKVEFKA